MKNRIPNIVTILVLTLITVIGWISINVYSALSSQTPPKIDAQIIADLDPKLDMNMVNIIAKKQESKTSDLTIVRLQTPPTLTPSPIPVPIETDQPEASTTAIATPTATP